MTLRKGFILLILLSLHHPVTFGQHQAQADNFLSENAYASILTCGPGNEFYETFGHSALRIVDSARGVDVVFNYGMFSFSEPHFYFKFARGRLNYFVTVQPYQEFMAEYDYFGRSVTEQRLNMSGEELMRLYKALIINAQPENKYYRYDIFHDNCATRVHDMVNAALDESDRIDFKNVNKHVSYRDLIHKYTGKHLKWWCFGCDILLGARCDRDMTTQQYMYIPAEMMTIYDTSVTMCGQKISCQPDELLPQTFTPQETVCSPALFFMLLFLIVLILTLVGKHKGWKLVWLDAVFFAVAAILSLLLLFMWFGSDHWCTKWNFNLLWANPLFVYLLFRLRKPCRGMVIATICCLAAAIVMWFIGWPQNFNSATILITLTLIVRLCARLETSGKEKIVAG